MSLERHGVIGSSTDCSQTRKHQSSVIGPFWWKFASERWIPFTNGQWCRKQFHVLISSHNTSISNLAVIMVHDSHYSDFIIRTMASQITGVLIVYKTFCSGTDQRKHQSSTSLAFIRRIHRWPMNSPHNGPVTRKMSPCDGVIRGGGRTNKPNNSLVSTCLSSCKKEHKLSSLWWRHNEHDGVSNHQPHSCLLNRLFRRRSKKHQSSASLAFVWGIHRDRWIPHTRGQLRGKCFHLMTSSCERLFFSSTLDCGSNYYAQCIATENWNSSKWQFIVAGGANDDHYSLRGHQWR